MLLQASLRGRAPWTFGLTVKQDGDGWWRLLPCRPEMQGCRQCWQRTMVLNKVSHNGGIEVVQGQFLALAMMEW